MLRVVIYPNLIVRPDQRSNPYIQDFIAALNRQPESLIVNPPHKNPLISLLLPKNRGDIYLFNWYESIPDFKYGMFQAFIATCLLLLLRCCGKKVVWMLHNKRPHADGHIQTKKFLMRLIARHSSLIVTHASEGVRLIQEHYPYAAHKIHFLHHPTKNRLHLIPVPGQSKSYDLLLWGAIAKYKGIFEFVRFVRDKQLNGLRICIIGGASESTFIELQQSAPENVTVINRRPSFEELADYIDRSEFVLAPYSPESVLSSSILMDSLSFGTKVIGPDVGSFHDYAAEKELKVYVFNNFEQIPDLIEAHRKDAISQKDYRNFLERNNWDNFARNLIQLITTPKQ